MFEKRTLLCIVSDATTWGSGGLWQRHAEEVKAVQLHIRQRRRLERQRERWIIALSAEPCLQMSLCFCSPAAHLCTLLKLALGKMPVHFQDSPSGWVTCVGVGTWRGEGQYKRFHLRVSKAYGGSNFGRDWKEMKLFSPSRISRKIIKCHSLLYRFQWWVTEQMA